MNAEKWHLKALAAALVTAGLLAALIGCTGATTSSTTTTSTTATGPGGGTIIHNDSIVTAQIQSIGYGKSGALTPVDILVLSSENVDDLANETADKVNMTISAETDEDLSSFAVGDKITAHVQLAGDVPLGTYLYMSDIKKTS